MPAKLTQERFLERCYEVHGRDKYDYTNSIYINSEIRVQITCSQGHTFMQIPRDHLSGCGCPICGRKIAADKQTLTQDEFIKQCHEAHGYDKYDYSLVQYVTNKVKVLVRCIKHDHAFSILPSNHTKLKNGCNLCGIETSIAKKRKTGNVVYSQEKYIELERQKHGDRFDLSLLNYTGCQNPVTLICRKHNLTFSQTASSHLYSDGGCPQCTKDGTSERSRYTQEEFIQACQLKHPNYIYTNTIYTGSKNKITVECPKHGEFTVRPIGHLHKNGCAKCARKVMTYEEFLQESRALHGNKYSYQKFDFIGRQENALIICPVHGEFKQQCRVHLQRGCPKCGLDIIHGFRKSKYIENCNAKQINPNLYFIKCWNDNEEFLKIGITIQSVKKRFKGKVNMPYNFKQINVVSGPPSIIWDLEIFLHRHFKDFSYQPKIYFGGETECYKIENLPEILKIWEENTSNLENHQSLNIMDSKLTAQYN